MIHVKITDDAFPRWPLIRQTPNASGIWGNCKFYVNEDIEECDVWIIYNSLKKAERTECSPQNVILITTEPPSVQQFKPGFLQQFARIITSHRDLDAGSAKITRQQQGQPWHVGKTQKSRKEYVFSQRYNYDKLTKITSFNKTKEISVITSNKRITEGHIKRIEFVERLKQHFGDQLDVFGRGIKDVDDKWDVIADYKYHIVIENSSYNDYWTEKLSDTYLAGAYPFYYGCPNLTDYFAPECFTSIDIHDIDQSISIIEKCINEGQYEKSIGDMLRARDQVLNQYNLFPMLDKFIQEHIINDLSKKEKVTIKPEKCWTSLAYRMKYWFY